MMTLNEFLAAVADVPLVELRMAMASAITNLRPAPPGYPSPLGIGSYEPFYRLVLQLLDRSEACTAVGAR